MDAFTDRAFAGNPAGVCVVERWPDAPWMQRVAAELNLSETAFARPRPDGDWDLRWFTPTVEADLCGHATLATAHALAEDELIDDVVRFHTRAGVLTVRVGDEVTLDFPAAARTEPANVDGVAQALCVEPQEVHWVPALREILAVLDGSRTVRELRPDLPAVSRLDGIRGVIVSACASYTCRSVVSHASFASVARAVRTRCRAPFACVARLAMGSSRVSRVIRARG